MKKKQLLIGGGIAVILLLLFGVWNLWFSATKVAFINYQVISLGQISKANDNSFIKISELSTDDLNRLTSYDMIFINAMGLRITEEQRAQIQKAADGGLPILTTAATNPANKIISLDSIQADTLKHYLSNGGRKLLQEKWMVLPTHGAFRAKELEQMIQSQGAVFGLSVAYIGLDGATHYIRRV